MHTIDLPTRDQVSPADQAPFDTRRKGLGMMHSLYSSVAAYLQRVGAARLLAVNPGVRWTAVLVQSVIAGLVVAVTRANPPGRPSRS